MNSDSPKPKRQKRHLRLVHTGDGSLRPGEPEHGSGESSTSDSKQPTAISGKRHLSLVKSSGELHPSASRIERALRVGTAVGIAIVEDRARVAGFSSWKVLTMDDLEQLLLSPEDVDTQSLNDLTTGDQC